jgi:carbamate kinase
VTLSELKKYKEEGHFAPGSMLPKIEAVIQFLEKGGARPRKAVITNPESLGKAVEGTSGTHVVPDEAR